MSRITLKGCIEGFKDFIASVNLNDIKPYVVVMGNVS